MGTNTNIVEKDNFEIADYIANQYIEKRNEKFINRFMFTDTRIEALPFIKCEVAGKVTKSGLIDFKDSHTDKERFIKANLVLRISKTSRVFYPQFNGKMGKKLGNWMKRPKSGGNIPRGFLTTSMARAELEERYKEQELLDDRVSYMKRKTLKEYIENHYSIDREDTPMDNGKCTPLMPDTKRMLLRDFQPWLDCKMEDVKPEWAKDFKSHFEKKRKKEVDHNTGEEKYVPISTGTMRKAFVAFKAMLGICKRLRYISKNPMMEQGHLFPENPVKEKNHFIINRGDVVSFIFSKEFDKYHVSTHPANFEGKLIVATVVLIGCRPIEVQSNYKKNFRCKERLINIQPGLQKKSGNGRNNPIENDLYWEMVQDFIDEHYIDNDDNRMFYSHNSAKGFVSVSKYRFHWQAIKEKFGLVKDDLLYHNRHAMSTDASWEIGSSKASSMLGHSESIADKNYRDTVSPQVREVMRKLQNSTDSSSEVDNTKEAPTTDSSEKTIELKGMPPSIKKMYDIFTGIREVPGENQLLLSDWLLLSSKIKSRLENGKLDNEAEDWFELIH
ncbi:MAG: hypothetical protein ACJAUY_001663 [Cognaticolwellia sp.]|jgi:hypothetical protein